MTAPAVDRTRARTATRPQPAARPHPVAPRPQLELLRSGRDAEHAERRLVRLAAAVGVGIAVLCLFGVVVAHVVLTQNQFRLDQLEQRASVRQAEYDRLRLQVAELESPDRIVATAQQQLGMVVPPKVTYLAPSEADAPSTGATPSSTVDRATATTGWSTVKPHLADG